MLFTMWGRIILSFTKPVLSLPNR